LKKDSATVPKLTLSYNEDSWDSSANQRHSISEKLAPVFTHVESSYEK